MSAKNIRVFMDTQRLIKNNDRLNRLTKDAVLNTELYFEHFTAKSKETGAPAIITAEETLTLLAARKLRSRYNKVAALNFANAIVPGGGVTLGANAQEEYLCRAGNLYKCLLKPGLYKDFYLYHLSLFNTYYSDRIIYSKRVTFFKDDIQISPSSAKYETRYTDDWMDIDVITSPAPNIRLKVMPNIDKVSRILEGRIRNILEVCIENKAQALVLGAFGCGAFGNNPATVAEAFRKILKDERYECYFKEIVFAVKPSKDRSNFTCFEQVF